MPTATAIAQIFHPSPIPPAVCKIAAIIGEAVACPIYTAIIKVADICPNSLGPNAAVPTNDGILAFTGYAAAPKITVSTIIYTAPPVAGHTTIQIKVNTYATQT